METIERIGIAITTRGREDVLNMSLRHFMNYKISQKNNTEVFLFIYSDAGNDVDKMPFISELKNTFTDFNIVRGENRLGISGAKNQCIKGLKEFNCDYFFLWDDDLFPKQDYWADKFIDAAKNNNVNHLLYLREVGKIKCIERKNGLEIYPECGGGMLFFTKRAIDTVGGYRKFPAPYGLEHGEITARIHKAGLQNGFRMYICPENCTEFIYSLDYDLNWYNISPPLYPNFQKSDFYSSMKGEDVKPMIDINKRLFSNHEVMKNIYEHI